MERHRIFESTEKRIDGNTTFCFIVRETSDSFFYTAPRPSVYTTQISSVCLYVSDYLRLSLFLRQVKSSLFVLELLLCLERAQ